MLNDRIALSLLLNDNLDKLEDARYLFIQGPDGSIISHTFINGFPRGLLSFGTDIQDPYKIKEFLSDGRKIYDIAVPILKGEIGILHLGVSMESGKKDIAEVAKINYYVAIVILIGLGIGIAVFLIMGFLFSSQIVRLKDFAIKIGNGDLEGRIEVNSKDEIGALASAFNEMALNLKDKVEEIKRLNTIDERNRIALDLHDGCAQDIANIIKRLELCERLFKIDPQQALKELNALKEISKDILNRTRQVIFSLKSSEDTDFNLLYTLGNYTRDFQKQNDIAIRLNVPDSMNSIPPDKSKSIFYIIMEALTNIRKHSEANNVELKIQANNGDSLVINIKDDGRGFDVNDALLNASKHGRLGLISMRQRAGHLGGMLAIESQPEHGTEVSITIPLINSGSFARKREGENRRT